MNRTFVTFGTLVFSGSIALWAAPPARNKEGHANETKTSAPKAESADLRDKCCSNKYGQGYLLARRLVEGGVRYVEAKNGRPVTIGNKGKPVDAIFA